MDMDKDNDLSPIMVNDLGDDDEAYIDPQADRSVVLTLRYPVTLTNKGRGGDEEDLIETIHFKRLTGAALMEAAERKGAKGTAYLLTASSGQPPLLWGRLDGEDFRRASDVVSGFTGKSQATGR